MNENMGERSVIDELRGLAKKYGSGDCEFQGYEIEKTLLNLISKWEMKMIWEGPWVCVKCGKSGSDYWRRMVTERGYHVLDENKNCNGKIIPYNRRRKMYEV